MMPGVPPLPNDEITTIFVVGFPDDMAEREFQNMFTFCPGFEAAALKIPLSSDGEDTSKKQIVIGFAKFRSVEEATRARDILSGKKIDTEKGCVIKAEMAKKNLHTKRSVSNSQDMHKSLYSNSIPSFRRRSVPESAGFDQNYYKSSQDYAQPFDPTLNYPNEYLPNSQYPSHFLDMTGDIFDPFAPPDPILDIDLAHNSLDPYYANEALSPTEEFDPKLPPLFGTSQPSRGFSSVLYNSDALLSKSLGSMTMGDFPESFSGRSGSFSFSSPMHPGADQNPPCNTLYVGNLPNDNCEEELRHLFQCCPGYKRLCFKTRSNGPMCFVEFENVHYATQALFQLYGNFLSNSTKGGIRLSYSKNPLGVRQTNNHPSPATYSSPIPIEGADKLPNNHSEIPANS